MTGWTRAKRSDDFGLMDALPALALISALFFGADWVQASAAEADADRNARDRAIRIAMQGRDAVMDVEFDLLDATEGFAPAPAAITEWALASAGAGDFAIEVSVTPLDTEGVLRRIEVRVGYEGPSGARESVSVSTLREDFQAAHARSRDGARPKRDFFDEPLTS